MGSGKSGEFKASGPKYFLGLVLVLFLSGLGLNLVGDLNLVQGIQVFKAMDNSLAAGAVTLTLGLWVIDAWRMQLLLKLAGASLSFFKVWQVGLAFAFAGAVTPAGVGAVPTQAYFFFRQGVKLEIAMVAATARMFLSMMFFALLNPVVLFLLHRQLGLSPLVINLTLGGAAAVSLMVMGFIYLSLKLDSAAPRLNLILPVRWREPFYNTAVAFKDTWSRLLTARDSISLTGLLLLTLIYWAGFFTVGWLLAIALGGVISWGVMVGRQMILYFLLSYLPLPGKSGAAEIGYGILFADTVAPGRLGILVASWRFLTFYLHLLIGGPVFWWLGKNLSKRGNPGKG